MKKLFIAVFMIILFISIGVAEETGICGDNLSWILDENGTLTISGNGEMDNYLIPSISPPWYNSRGKINKVVIENGVTSIGKEAFGYCTNLKDVTVVGALNYIGEYAFRRCSKLNNVSIAPSPLEVGNSVFYECTSLTSFAFPEGTTKLGAGIFYYCNSLASVYLPDSITYASSIFMHAGFNGIVYCSIDNPGAISLGTYNYSFRESENSEYELRYIVKNNIQTGLEIINANKDIVHCNIPENVTRIGNSAFDGCSQLTDVYLPDSITYIDDYAFRNCSNLQTIMLTDNIEHIGNRAFYSCTSINSISYKGETANNDGISDLGYYGDFIWFIDNNRIVHFMGAGNLECENPVNDIKALTDFYYSRPALTIVVHDGITRLAKQPINFFSNTVSLTIPTSVIDIDIMLS